MTATVQYRVKSLSVPVLFVIWFLLRVPGIRLVAAEFYSRHSQRRRLADFLNSGASHE